MIRSLEGRERLFGNDHQNTLSTVNNMAILRYDQGQFEAAKALYQRAYEGYHLSLGHDHPTTVSVRENMQLCLDAIGNGEVII